MKHIPIRKGACWFLGLATCFAGSVLLVVPPMPMIHLEDQRWSGAPLEPLLVFFGVLCIVLGVFLLYWGYFRQLAMMLDAQQRWEEELG